MVVRHLPPSLLEESFLAQVAPLPTHDYFSFVKGNLKLAPFAFSRFADFDFPLDRWRRDPPTVLVRCVVPRIAEPILSTLASLHCRALLPVKELESTVTSSVGLVLLVGPLALARIHCNILSRELVGPLELK